jgi:GT2 family glycosyltransferase
MLIDIVIVNYKSDALVHDLVRTIISHDSEFDYNIIVVDNGSLDGSIHTLEKNENIRLISLESNRGFSVACNIGASYGGAEFVLFLNPDCKFHLPVGSDLIKTISQVKYDEFGIFGIQLLSNDFEVSTSCYRFPSIKSVLSSSLGLGKLLPKLGLSSAMDDFDHNSDKTVDVVMGAFFLVKKKIFINLNGFDERYFVYFEEVDFCYRAKLLGYKTAFISNLSVIHLGCGTTKNIKGTRLFYSLRSRIQFFYKNRSLVVFMMVLLVTSCVELFSRLFMDILKLSSPKDTLYGYFLYFRWLITRGKD